MIDLQQRRTFLRAAMAAGAAWAAADLTQVEDALAWAAEQARTPREGAGQAAALTKAQAAVVEAMTARILPSVDGRPGAREAGAVHFIDRALATFNAAQKTLYLEGIADLDAKAALRSPASSGSAANTANTAKTDNTANATKTVRPTFVTLTAAQQDELLREIENTPFFQTVRFDTLVGTFALPTWGGNRDFAGWRLLGIEHRPFFQAPFGYYDANANSAGGKD